MSEFTEWANAHFKYADGGSDEKQTYAHHGRIHAEDAWDAALFWVLGEIKRRVECDMIFKTIGLADTGPYHSEAWHVRDHLKMLAARIRKERT